MCCRRNKGGGESEVVGIVLIVVAFATVPVAAIVVAVLDDPPRLPLQSCNNDKNEFVTHNRTLSKMFLAHRILALIKTPIG